MLYINIVNIFLLNCRRFPKMIGFVHIVYANTVGWLWTWLLRKKDTMRKKKASSAPNVTGSVKFLVIHLALFIFISFSVESGLLYYRAFGLLKLPQCLFSHL